MKHLSTNYWQFLNESATPTAKPHPIDYDEINCLKDRIKKLNRQMIGERDPNIKKRLSMQVKVAELKIMIAQIQ